MDIDRMREDPWHAPEWYLLSYRKAVSSSAHTAGNESENAMDENVQTWWRAASAVPGAWLAVNLGEAMEFHAVQINFADNPGENISCSGELVSGLDMARYIDGEVQPTQWLLEASVDGNA